MFASTCHSLNDKLDEVPLCPEVSNETRKAGSDRREYVAVGGRHTFKFGKLESLQTRVGGAGAPDFRWHNLGRA